jgi:hypothetical protein
MELLGGTSNRNKSGSGWDADEQQHFNAGRQNADRRDRLLAHIAHKQHGGLCCPV